MGKENLRVVSREMMSVLTYASVQYTPSELMCELTHGGVLNPDPLLIPLKKWYKEVCFDKSTVQLMIIKHVYLNEPQFKAEPMKWIVETKESAGLAEVWRLKDDGGIYRMMTARASGQTVYFSTKEEAEKWTNPQTKAVEVEN